MVTCTLSSDSENKVDDNSSQQEETKHSGAESIIIGARASSSNSSSSPVVSDKGISHSSHGYQSEQTSRDSSDLITKVKQTNSQTTEDDSEIQPRKKSSFVGKENFGFDSGGQSNSLA